MSTASGEFEKSLARLEEIVARLEGDGVSLDESVALFKEGKTLAGTCERLLREAQTAIETARAPEAAGTEATLFGASGGRAS